MNRGDVWMIDLGGPIGIRPVLILTRQNIINYLNKVTVAEITTRAKGYPTEIFIDQKGSLPKPSFVQADKLHTVPKRRLKRHIGTLDSNTMLEIAQKVVLSLELEDALPDR